MNTRDVINSPCQFASDITKKELKKSAVTLERMLERKQPRKKKSQPGEIEKPIHTFHNRNNNRSCILRMHIRLGTRLRVRSVESRVRVMKSRAASRVESSTSGVESSASRVGHECESSEVRE